MSNFGGIYAIVNAVTQQVYIGSSVYVTKRWNEHEGHLRAGTHGNARLLSAWRKHGEQAFYFTTLEYVEDIAQLHIREQHYLDLHQPNVYNVGTDVRAYEARIGRPHSRKGVPSGYKPTPEVAARIAASLRGRPLSEDHIQQMRDGWKRHRAEQTHCAKGHELTPETSRIILKADGSHYCRRCLTCRAAGAARQVAKAHKSGRPARNSEAHRAKLRQAWNDHKASRQEALKAGWAKSKGEGKLPTKRGPMSDEHKAALRAGHAKGRALGRIQKPHPPRTDAQKAAISECFARRKALGLKNKPRPPISEEQRAALRAAWVIRKQREMATYIRTPDIIEKQRDAARQRKSRKPMVH